MVRRGTLAAALAVTAFLLGSAAQAAETGTRSTGGVLLAQYGGPPPGYGQGYDNRGGYDGRRGDDRRGYDDRRGNDDRRGSGGDSRYGAQSGYGPGGSYQGSCSEIRQEGGTLVAVCRDGRGGRVQTSIDTNRCGRSDIANVGGYLRCGNVQGNGRRVN